LLAPITRHLIGVLTVFPLPFFTVLPVFTLHFFAMFAVLAIQDWRKENLS
jgi:hypothetical protein